MVMEDTQESDTSGSSIPIDQFPNKVKTCIVTHDDTMQASQLMQDNKRWSDMLRRCPELWCSVLHIDRALWESAPKQLYRRQSEVVRLSGKGPKELAPPSRLKYDYEKHYYDGRHEFRSQLPGVCQDLVGNNTRVSIILVKGLYSTPENTKAVFDYLDSSMDRFESLILCFERDDGYDEEYGDIMIYTYVKNKNIKLDTAEAPSVRGVQSGVDADDSNSNTGLRVYIVDEWPIDFNRRWFYYNYIYSCLTVLHVEKVSFDRPSDRRALYQLLKSVQGRLIELFLNLKDKALPYATLLDDAPQTPLCAWPVKLRFTKLVRLHLGYKEFWEPLDPAEQRFEFHCPTVKSVSLNCQAPYALFRNALSTTSWSWSIGFRAPYIHFRSVVSSSITSLRIHFRTFAWKENVQELKQCIGLEKLYADLRFAQECSLASAHDGSFGFAHEWPSSRRSRDSEYIVIAEIVRMAPVHLLLYINIKSSPDYLGYLVERIVDMRRSDTSSLCTITLCNVEKNCVDALQRELDRLREVVPNVEYIDSADQIASLFPSAQHRLGSL